MSKIEMPEWLVARPKKTLITVAEFARAMGLSYDAVVWRKNNHSHFPVPDFTVSRCSAGQYKPMWKAVTVRNYIRQLNRGEFE